MNKRHNPDPRPTSDRQQWETSEYQEWCRELDPEELAAINRMLNGDDDGNDS
jgi:hypothetical protein